MAKGAIHLEIKGVKDLRRLLDQGNRKVIQATRKTVFEVANEVKVEAQALVPFDEGILSGTANVDMLMSGANLKNPTAFVTFGGPGAPYALRQHEERRWRHKPGRTWGYLSKPTKKAMRDFDKRIINRIKELLR